MRQLIPSKTYLDYNELVSLLIEREMNIDDRSRAERKISQVGYYRLSGYWYPFRKYDLDAEGRIKIEKGSPARTDHFIPGTNFDDIFELYTFDKRLRLLLMDAIERIEINLRTIIAHTLGKEDPIAYQSTAFINPSKLYDFYNKRGQLKNSWTEWQMRSHSELSRSREESIVWHIKKNKQIPFWVACEAWTFGTISKYFELLKRQHQNKIAKQLGISNSTILSRWLQELNNIRNKCAHHSRLWNHSFNNPLQIPTEEGAQDTSYFSELKLDTTHCKKIYFLIVVAWYLVKNIGPNSDWIKSVITEINNLPELPINIHDSMGIPEHGLDLNLFG